MGSTTKNYTFAAETAITYLRHNKDPELSLPPSNQRLWQNTILTSFSLVANI